MAAKGETGEADKFLAVIFPAGQLRIMPYNRVVHDLNGLTEEEFLRRLRQVAVVKEAESGNVEQAGSVRMYLSGRWLELVFAADKQASATDVLDVSVLQARVLQPILGIDDPRTSQRIDFVGGIRGLQELERLVDDGVAQVAFSMYPTTVEQLMDIADAGQTMPPKSTWFEPKLRDGLFVHEI